MVSAVAKQLTHYFDLEKKLGKNPSVDALNEFNEQCLFILRFFRDLGALPKQYVDLKRKVQITGSNDKETTALDREAFINDDKAIEL